LENSFGAAGRIERRPRRVMRPVFHNWSARKQGFVEGRRAMTITLTNEVEELLNEQFNAAYLKEISR
jgi:hypothetical protein